MCMSGLQILALIRSLLGAGILNVILLILFAANFRLIVENLLKYGVLVNPLNWVKALVPRGKFLGVQVCGPVALKLTR